MAKKEKKKSTFWKDFKAFISRGNVIDMAIGVVVANAFKDIVTKFTDGFISPIVGLLTDGVVLSELKWVLREAVVDAADATTIIKPEVAFAWGAFVQSIVDFLIIAFALFIVIRVATRAANKAKELHAALDREEKEAAEAAAAEAAAKAEADKKAAEDAAAAAIAAAEAEKNAALEREKETVALLREIRDSLSKK